MLLAVVLGGVVKGGPQRSEGKMRDVVTGFYAGVLSRLIADVDHLDFETACWLFAAALWTKR